MTLRELKIIFSVIGVLISTSYGVASPLAEEPQRKCQKPEYPRQALRREEEGVTLLGFRVNPDGTVTQVIVLNSSGSSSLDRAGIDALTKCTFFFSALSGRQGNWIGLEYNWFSGGDPRKSSVAEKLKIAAEEGDVAARYHLSLILRAYATSDTEHQQAIALLQSAATQGFAHAQFELGRNFEKGIGMKADSAEAMRWYEKAAANGDVFAIERLQVGVLSY